MTPAVATTGARRPPGAAPATAPAQGEARSGPRLAPRLARVLGAARPLAAGPNHVGAGPIPAPRAAADVRRAVPAPLVARLAAIVGARAVDAARIHTGPAAHARAIEHRARAVADGEDIYFADGEYRPGTRAGDALLAHELAHVDQAQRGLLRRPARKAMGNAEHTALEAAADTAGDKLTAGADLDKHERPARAPRTPGATAPTPAGGAEVGKAPAAAAPTTDAERPAAPGAAEGPAALLAPAGAPKPALGVPPELPRMPEPPSALSSKELGRVGGVEGRAGTTATATATAPAAAENVSVAQAAVAVPQQENDARAAEQVVAKLAEREPPSPEIVALCKRIKELIAKKRPADEDAVIDTRPQEVAQDAGGTVEGDVKKNVDDANAAYGAITATPAGPAPAAPGAIEPLPEQVAAPPVNATAATPDPVPPETVNLDADSAEMDKQSKDAGLENETAQLVQSGPVAEARDARGELKSLGKDGPAEALKQQQLALAQADTDMAALQLKALASLQATRKGHVGAVKDQQGEFKGGEEALRRKLAADAAAIYDDAKTRVQDLLSPVHDVAMKKWSTGLPVISKRFNDDLKVVKDKIEDRHSGVGGFFVAGWDAVAGLPDWVSRAYDAAEQHFGDDVCALITDISADVNTVIKACDDIIAEARRQIAAIFTTNLPDGLKDWAAEQQQGFAKKLDQLHDKAEATRSKFTKELIDNAGGAVQAAREKIQKLRKEAGGLWGRFLDAVGRFLDDPLKFIIDGLLELVGISPKAFWALIDKISQVISDIAWHPIKFISNLMDGVGAGFDLFFKNFATHLRKGFFEWLFSGLKDLGVEVPADFSLKSIITFFLQLMGISWPRIRKMLAEVIGEKYVAAAEKALKLVEIIAKGPQGIIDFIKDKLTPEAILERILEMAIKYVVETLIKQVALYIIKLLNPVGAVLAAIETIYKVVKWIFQNAARIFHFIEAIVNALAAVIAGDIGVVAKGVESGLAMLIPPVIAFLADLIGLGDLPDQIAKIVKSLQAWVEGIIKSIIKFLADTAKSLLASLGIGGKDENDKKDAAGAIGETLTFTSGKETHHLYIDVAGANASVMVSSTPMTASAWLDSLEKDIKMVGDKEQPEGARPLIASARQQIAKTDADADKAAAQQAAPAEGTAPQGDTGSAVKSDEESLNSTLQQLGTLFGTKVPPIIKSLSEGSPIDLESIGTALATSIEGSTGTQTIYTASASQNELVEQLLKNNPDAYDENTGRLTLPDLGSAGFSNAASLSELGKAVGAKAGVSQVAFTRTDEGGTIKLGASPSTSGGKVTTVAKDRPKVGTYSKLAGVTDYTPHHVPPKGLANWIYQQAMTIPKDIGKLKDVKPVIDAAMLASAEHAGGGARLSSILIHKNTHITKTGDPATDDYRVHHGKATAELVGERLKAKGIKPIIKGGEILDNPADLDPADLAMALEDKKAGGADEVAVGKASTQFYLKELNAARAEVEVTVKEDVDEFLGSTRDVFARAWAQSREAVGVGLENSGGRDGSPDAKKAALGELDPLAVRTWTAISNPNILKLISFG